MVPANTNLTFSFCYTSCSRTPFLWLVRAIMCISCCQIVVLCSSTLSPPPPRPTHASIVFWTVSIPKQFSVRPYIRTLIIDLFASRRPILIPKAYISVQELVYYQIRKESHRRKGFCHMCTHCCSVRPLSPLAPRCSSGSCLSTSSPVLRWRHYLCTMALGVRA